MLQLQDNPANAADPTPEEKLEQLDKILHSRTFQGAGIVLTLLQYLVEHSITNPDQNIKEYTIALEVLNRGSEFDPRTNSIVRVQARRLRSKLQEYYESEGKSDEVIMDLPKGHYKVVFSYAQPVEETSFSQDLLTDVTPLSSSPAIEVVSRFTALKADFTKPILVSTVVIMSIAIILLALPTSKSSKETQVPSSSLIEPDYSTVWSSFLLGKNSTLLILSNPPVFRFLNNSDSELVTKDAVPVAPEQAQAIGKILNGKLVMKQRRSLKLVLSTSRYTGMGEAIGLYSLTDMFRGAGKELILKQSRTVSAEDLKNHNVILLGSAWVNEWVEKLPIKEDFIYGVNANIENNNPYPGEEREYKPAFNSKTGMPEEDYALITVKPGVTEENRLMTLAGLLSEGTQAAAEYVTRKTYVSDLNRRLLQLADEDGPPKFYQVLLKVAVDNGIPTTVTVVAVHPLKVKRD